MRDEIDRATVDAWSMGWPDQAIRMTTEHLEKASKAQTGSIDQIMDTWQQMMSPGAMGVPRSFSGQMPALPGSAMPTFAPRTWMPDADNQKDRFRSH
jgi:hypothetical protein